MIAILVVQSIVALTLLHLQPLPACAPPACLPAAVIAILVVQAIVALTLLHLWQLKLVVDVERARLRNVLALIGLPGPILRIMHAKPVIVSGHACGACWRARPACCRANAGPPRAVHVCARPCCCVTLCVCQGCICA